MNIQEITDNTIMLGLGGSHAYGMAREGSDLDIRGLTMPPVHCLLSPFQSFEQWIPKGQQGPWDPLSTEAFANLTDFQQRCLEANDNRVDVVLYSVIKFISLASKCNPNVLELLYLDDNDILFANYDYETLREHRDMFLTVAARGTYVGYAVSQLKRIKTHRSWLLSPPKRAPERIDFRLGDKEPLSGEIVSEIKSTVNTVLREWDLQQGMDDLLTGPARNVVQERMLEFYKDVLTTHEEIPELTEIAMVSVGIPESVRDRLRAERDYQHAKNDWDSYTRWQKNRNTERAALERKFGMDTKHAAHVVRLLRQGCEILSGKGLTVRRPDAEELLRIRDGEMTYDELVEESNALLDEINNLAKTSTLPKKCNTEDVDSLIRSLYRV